ncbi:MAG: beta strand repeat-containing protein, partial [Verrucomicrobiota bacterium]
MKKQFPINNRALLAAGSAVFALALSSAHAQTATWNGAGSDNNWSTGANWGGTAPVANNLLTFNGTTRLSSNNDIAADTTFGSITFNSGAGAFTLSGNRITLSSGNRTIQNSSTNTQTIALDMILSNGAIIRANSGAIVLSGNLSGTGSIFKNSTAFDLTLSGNNTFNGRVEISRGNLTINSINSVGSGQGASALGTASTSTNGQIALGDAAGANSATLIYTGAAATTDRQVIFNGRDSGANAALDQSGTGLLKFTSNLGFLAASGNNISRTLTLQGSTAGTGEFAGVIANQDLANGKITALTKAGSGTWVLSGANSYTGATTINGGTLQIGGGSTTGALSTSSAITNNGTLVFNRSNTVTQGTDFVNGIAGTGALTQAGAGTLVLSASNSYSGLTSVNAGILSVRHNNALGTSAGATTVAAGGQLQLQGDITVTGEALTISNNSTAGLVNASGTNTWTGSVTSTGASTAGRVSSSAGLLTLSGSVSSDASQGLILGGAGNLTISGAISGGRIFKNGAGSLTLSGSNTFNGLLEVAAGTVSINSINSVGSGQGASALGTASTAGNGAIRLGSSSGNTTGTLIYTGGAATTDRQVFLQGLQAGADAVLDQSGTGLLKFTSALGSANSNNNVTRTLTLQGSTAGTGEFAGVIANQDTATGKITALTKAGTGTWTLSANNTYTGNTTVSEGTLAINGSVAGAVAVNSGATLQGSGSIGGALSVSGQLSPGNSIESIGASSVSFLNGSTYAYELDSSVLGGDLLYTTGALSIASTTTLSLTELASGTLAMNGKLTLISYGTWNGGLFTYNGSTLNNGDKFTLGSNEWLFKYDDTSGGNNFLSDQAGASRYITMTVVPEP